MMAFVSCRSMQKKAGLLLLCFLVACGQGPGTKILPEIKNTRTSHHVNIPGTRLYLIPPENFKVASTFLGLQKDAKTNLMVLDMTPGNFYTNAANFSKTEFEKKAVKVLEYKEVAVDGFPAKYIHAQNGTGDEEYSLVFGDSTFSTMLMAIFAQGDKTAG